MYMYMGWPRISGNANHTVISLAHHTPQSEGKRGLVTMRARTASYSRGMQ